MASRLKRFGKALIVRSYALVILLLVAWTGYTAVSYLFAFVFRPAEIPASLRDWQGHLDVAALRAESVPGVGGPAARAPLGHYHGVTGWFQPDRANGCLTSGCHDPLPHRKSKSVRAFANMHVAYLDCLMCHVDVTASPAPAAWVNTETGNRRDAPAVLVLLRRFDTTPTTGEADMRALHEEILRRLPEAIDAIGSAPVLDHLRLVVETSEPGSPVWRHAVDRLAAELPNHLHGEYRAKLVPEADAKDWTKRQARLADLAKKYEAAPTDGAERKRLYDDAHAGIVAKPSACLACHGGDPPRLDFEAVGYSPRRAEELRNAPIAGLMQRIQQGEPFHLPQLLRAEDER